MGDDQQVNGESGGFTGAMPTAWRRATPLANTAHPIIAQPVANIEGTIFPIVGASRQLDCNGNWVLKRDAHDIQMVNQYTNNTGTSVLHQSEVLYGGYAVIPGGTPCSDADHDGMPDVWETARGLNPNSAADRNAVAASGYTNLEVYLAGTGSGTAPPPPPPPPRLPRLPPGDTTLPTVSIAAPVNGSTVSGSAVTVSANASDNIGVASVDLKVDSTTIFSNTTPPYSTVWDTTTIANGSHTITAIARDGAGNVETSAGVSITVNNVVGTVTAVYPPNIQYSPISVPNLARPGYLVPITDPASGATITRITDAAAFGASNVRHGYSRREPWNSNQTLILLDGVEIPKLWILDARTYKIFGTVPRLADIRWSHTDPNKLYGVSGNRFVAINASTGTMTTVHTFSGYGSILIGPYKGNLSNDDKIRSAYS